MNVESIQLNKSEVENKKVFVRASLNVPLIEGRVGNAFRLERALPTIQFLTELGAVVVLAGHIGRDKSETLEPVYMYLKNYIDLTFVKDLSDAKAVVDTAEKGSVVLLENLRQYDEETNNDPQFGHTLSQLADVYVNDAFAASHREHASIVGVPKHLPGYIGFEFQDEIDNLQKAFTPPQKSLFVLGGAKFETKQPLIEKFLDTYGSIFIGGALSNDFFKAKGLEVGKSLLSSEALNLEHLVHNPKVVLPHDVVVKTEDNEKVVKSVEEVQSDDTVLDVGPESASKLIEHARTMEFVLWNGPFGNYEEGFKEQTETFARALANMGASSIVGGGDTVASISTLNLLDKFTFVSTGGGAMLEYLQHGTLPGIEALKNN